MVRDSGISILFELHLPAGNIIQDSHNINSQRADKGFCWVDIQTLQNALREYQSLLRCLDSVYVLREGIIWTEDGNLDIECQAYRCAEIFVFHADQSLTKLPFLRIFGIEE